MPATGGPGSDGRWATACLGGTFDHLHRGHEALLLSAVRSGRKVLVGVASDRMASGHRGGVRLQPYSLRARRVASFLKAHGAAFQISKIEDRFGPALTGPYDVIVVSAEKRGNAELLNRLRRRRDLRPLRIIEVGMVPAEDGLPISSTRVRSGEMDAAGRLRELKVVVGSTNPVKVSAVRMVLRRALPGRSIDVRGVAVSSAVPSEPYGRDVINGAIQRAQTAIEKREAHLSVGIEAGLFWCEHLQDYMDVQYCAIIDRGERITLGHGPGFQYPPGIMSRVRDGRTVGQAMAELSGIEQIGRQQGVVGYLSKGMMVRKRLTETAVIAAMLPRLNSELYFFG